MIWGELARKKEFPRLRGKEIGDRSAFSDAASKLRFDFECILRRALRDLAWVFLLNQAARQPCRGWERTQNGELQRHRRMVA